RPFRPSTEFLVYGAEVLAFICAQVVNFQAPSSNRLIYGFHSSPQAATLTHSESVVLSSHPKKPSPGFGMIRSRVPECSRESPVDRTNSRSFQQRAEVVQFRRRLPSPSHPCGTSPAAPAIAQRLFEPPPSN